jgi:DNA-directed RNA polymerase beta' subunit
MELYKSVLGRSFTLCDLLFIACSKAIEDKYCYITRYPITSHQSTNPVKPVIVSTENTVEMDFRSPDGKESVIGGLIKNYPDINSKKYWRDSAIFDNLMTAAFNADFDGDQISVIGLFTKEANLEAERLINSKVNLVRADGSPAREIGNEAILSLYMMTK